MTKFVSNYEEDTLIKNIKKQQQLKGRSAKCSLLPLAGDI